MLSRTSLRLLATAAVVLTASTAAAETHITQHITESTVWNAAGSPYILHEPVHVLEGATLTVRGATVLFAADSIGRRRIAVFGRLDCRNSLFTSIEDSAPGQWYSVGYRTGSEPALIEGCEFRHGGFGSANHAYGALDLGPETDVVVVDSSFRDNERSGIVMLRASLEVYDSTFEGNAHGVSVSQSYLTMTGSTLTDNRHGLVFLHSDAYDGPRSVVDGNVITGNTDYGIVFGTSHVFADGTGNVIHSNGNRPEQIHSFYTWPDADWRGNDFGTTFPCPCPWANSPIKSHTSNSLQCYTKNKPPEGGPMSSSVWGLPVDDKTVLYCRSDKIPTATL